MYNPADIIIKGVKQLGLSLPNGAVDSFILYSDILLEKRQNVNLTAINTSQDISTVHFLDSLSLLNIMDFKNKYVLDIGSGAGFPGIPLKIAEPSIKLTVLDATKKRIDFLQNLCHDLKLDVHCIHARAEDAAASGQQEQYDMREKYDIVVSRAVADLSILSELCIPFLQVGGIFLAMKSINSDDEISNARNAISKLGAEITCVTPYNIPLIEIKHCVVIIRKISPTPDTYPRRFAAIKKRSL
jgi:16S rRNA (guanine527-N7)-methyltransferase